MAGAEIARIPVAIVGGGPIRAGAGVIPRLLRCAFDPVKLLRRFRRRAREGHNSANASFVETAAELNSGGPAWWISSSRAGQAFGVCLSRALINNEVLEVDVTEVA